MQDNKDIANIDKQLTDLGWEKMQGVLDKEMPVTPVCKRRWRWLWLLLFLGIIASGTYYNFVIKNTVQPNKIPEAAIANEIENPNDNDELITPRTDDFPESSYGTGSSREKIAPSTAKVIGTDVPKIITKKDVPKNIIQHNLNIKKANNLAPKRTLKEQPIIPQNKVELNNTTNRTSNTLEVPVASNYFNENISIPESSSAEHSSRNSLINAERISTLSPQITRNNNTMLLSSPSFDPIPKARKSSQTYSAFAGARTDELSRFGGFNMGLLAHYRFTSKVGLETGLMYSNTRKNIRANIDYTNTVNELYPDNTLEYRSNIEDVHNYNYFRLPLSLTYRPHNKIQLAMGLSAGYRFDNIIGNLSTQEDLALFSPQADQDESNYESEIELNIPANDPLAQDELERITVPYSLAVRRIDVAAQAGVRYYPTPRLGIDLNYQYGLLNMTKNTTVNRNSGLQLALVWQLHR